MAHKTVKLPPHYRRNFFLLLTDYTCFGLALNFMSVDSVMTSFVAELTSLAPLVGLVSTIFRGGWLLPQLAVARLINDRPRKKPFVMAGISGRLIFSLVPVALWVSLGGNPRVTLLVFFAALSTFAVTDGLASVAWFDILARAIPLRRRGRMMGVGQVLIGLSGMGAGAVVSLILGNPTISFPHNYAILFTIGCGIFVLSALALSLVREPPPDLTDADTGAGLQGRWWTQVLGDPLFRRFSICRVFVAMVTLATPFYVLHARDVLLLPPRVIGGFVSAQMLGGVIAGAVLGPVCERWGPRYVVRVGSAAAALAPLLAFLIHIGGGPLVRFYPLIYLLLGVLNSTWTLGFMNYLLEIAPPGMNSAYIGLGNTISGLMMIVPPLGGALLELTSYPVLFGLTATLVGTGLVLSMTLRPSATPSAGDEAA